MIRETITITQDQANELLNSLAEYPIPYKYSGVILIVQKWLADKFQEGLVSKDTFEAFEKYEENKNASS